jgi:ComF family protein
VCCADTIDAFSMKQGKTLCRRCRLAPPPFEKAVAFALYGGRMREALHELKFERRQSAVARLAAMLASSIAQLAGEAPAEMLVVPVPLHRSRLRARGFNQARLLAVRALDLLAKSHPEWKLTLAPQALVRTRATASQAQLSPHGRRMNLRGAFRVPDEALVADRDVLLLDDILTTGATARMAAAALRRAGAKSVWVATVARARQMSYEAAADEAGAGNRVEVQDMQSFDQPSSWGEETDGCRWEKP